MTSDIDAGVALQASDTHATGRAETMRLSDGRDLLEFRREGDQLTVLLVASQIQMSALDVVREQASVADEVPEGFHAALVYTLSPGSRSLRVLARRAKTRVQRLELAQRLSVLEGLAGRFRVPFLNPENIMVTGQRLRVVHSGLVNIVTPMSYDDELFLKGYKALVLGIFNPKLSFEKLVDGSISLKDSFSKKIVACASVGEVAAYIDEQLVAETARVRRDVSLVPKGRYRFLKVFGVVVAAGALVLGWFTYSAYRVTQPKQNAVITAQSDFLTSNYGKTLTDLEKYSPSQLPKSARYVLAVSSVNLTDLTSVQKQAVLNNVSVKSDDNTLNYWVYLGRGDFNQALNLAQNLGDNQLTLLAYTDLYEATKLNTSMDGATKQQKLDDYRQKIADLTKALRQK